jgi:hypothetical protein
MFFPGIPEIPAIEFFIIKWKKGLFLKKIMQYWVTLFGATRLVVVLSKFVTVDGKYWKCYKDIYFTFQSYSRESRTDFPGKQE